MGLENCGIPSAITVQQGVQGEAYSVYIQEYMLKCNILTVQ